MWRRSQTSKSDGRSVDVILEANNVFLRPPEHSDYRQWEEVRRCNQSYLQPFEPAWPPRCLERDFFQRRVERLLQEWLADRCYGFLIFEKTQGTLVGAININNVTRGAAQQASLGYWLDQASQGKGWMNEAGRGVLSYAFGTLGLDRMNAATLVHNHKSRNMLLKLGFVEEGFAKAYIQIDGRRQDHVLYGLNAPDFH